MGGGGGGGGGAFPAHCATQLSWGTGRVWKSRAQLDLGPHVEQVRWNASTRPCRRRREEEEAAELRRAASNNSDLEGDEEYEDDFGSPGAVYVLLHLCCGSFVGGSVCWG